MNRFILICVYIVIIVGCSSNISPKKTELDVVHTMNKEIQENPSALGGSVYYVCDTGSDENTGLSPDLPWFSFSRVAREFRYLNAGDTIAFCRGGVIEVPEYKRFINIHCRTERPCVFRDYYEPQAIGNEALPILKSTNDNGIFYFSRRSNTQGEGIVVKNLELIGNGKGKGIFVLNGVSHIRLHNLKISDFRVAVDFSTSGGNLSSKVFLTSSKITDNTDQGWLGGCSDCIIDGNVFINNGFSQAIRTHNIYFSGYDSDNVKIINNKLYKSAVIDGKCTSVSLVAHGTISNLLIENNLVSEDRDGAKPTCYGIGIGPGYPGIEEWFKNVIIRDNVVINSGNVSIGCSSCVDVLIENNKITHSNTTFHSGIKVPVGPEDSLKSDRIVIRENQIGIYGEKSRYKKSGISVKIEGDILMEDNSVQFNNSDYSCFFEDKGFKDNNSCRKIFE